MNHKSVAAHVDAMYQARRQATEGYNELHRLAHSLRDVGMSALAAKIDAAKEKLDPMFDESIAFVSLFNLEHGDGAEEAP